MCQELRTKRGKTDNSRKEEQVIKDPLHKAGIGFELGQENTIQLCRDSLSKVSTPVQPVKKHPLTADRHTANPTEGSGDSESDILTDIKTSLQATDPSAAVHAALAPVLADYSASMDYLMPVAKKTRLQAEASSQARQPLPVDVAVNGPQEPYFKDPQETENRSLKSREAEPLSLTCLTTCIPAAGSHAMEANPAVVNETGRQPAEFPISDQPVIAPQLTRPPTPRVISPTAHITEHTDAVPQSIGMAFPAEAQWTESPASHTVSRLRSANSLLPAHGSAYLHDREHDNNIGAANVEATEQEEAHMGLYSQSVPSEMEVQLYSDEEETPYQNNHTRNCASPLNYHNGTTRRRVNTYNCSSNTCNYGMGSNVNNQEERAVEVDNISPEVSTQCALSKQSSIISDWLPANQEQAARMSPPGSRFLEDCLSLQDQERLSQPVQAQANASNTYPTMDNGNNNCHYDDYDFRGDSYQYRSRSCGVNVHDQERGQGHVSLVRLPSDPEDMDALSPILGSQGGFSYGPGSRDVGISGAGGVVVMQGVCNAHELGAVAEDDEDEEIDDSLSEWIQDDEWFL